MNIHHEEDANPAAGGILLTLGQLSAWAGLGRDLTGDELDQIADCIPNSSIPDAVNTIARDALRLRGPEDEADLLSEARDWIWDCFSDTVDASTLTDPEVRQGIERHYDGGWAQFEKDNT
jgi:hypothetical protein